MTVSRRQLSFQPILLKSIVSFCIFMITFLIFISTFQYLVITVFYPVESLQPAIALMLFLTLLVVFSQTDLPARIPALLKHQAIFLLILLVLTTLFYSAYLDFHEEFLRTPHILSVDKQSVIQGDTITVVGRGFGDGWERGSIQIDSFKLEERIWTDRLIQAIIPVPQDYFKGELYIINHRGKRSNSVDVEILSPSEVLK